MTVEFVAFVSSAVACNRAILKCRGWNRKTIKFNISNCFVKNKLLWRKILEPFYPSAILFMGKELLRHRFDWFVSPIKASWRSWWVMEWCKNEILGLFLITCLTACCYVLTMVEGISLNKQNLAKSLTLRRRAQAVTGRGYFIPLSQIPIEKAWHHGGI